jgi:hypothetical protein
MDHSEQTTDLMPVADRLEKEVDRLHKRTAELESRPLPTLELGCGDCLLYAVSHPGSSHRNGSWTA